MQLGCSLPPPKKKIEVGQIINVSLAKRWGNKDKSKKYVYKISIIT
jgi:hypothetical protein